MKLAFLLVAASALLLLPPPKSVIAKNASIGIYAIVDQVTFEPETGPPRSVRISGTFVVPVPMSSGNYRSRRGAIFIFGLRRGQNRQHDAIGANSRPSLGQAKWWDLVSIGYRTPMTRKAIHTTHWKSQCTQRVTLPRPRFIRSLDWKESLK